MIDRPSDSRWLRRVLMIAVLGLIPLGVAGCQIPYLVSQLGGQTRLIASARPIDAVRTDPETSDVLRTRLDEVEELLEFARSQGFEVGDAYRTYAEPVEGYPVWIVSACPPDALESVMWEFPIVGAFPYKGFFHRRLAEHEAARLRAEGYEVDLRPAVAFSTLGWFSDPVLPTLIDGDAGQRAAGILHELAHRTVFVPGDPRLNESISVSVEQYAVRAWLEKRGDADAIAEHGRRCADREHLRAAVAGLLEELRTVFEAPERSARLEGKEAALDRFRARLDDTPFTSARYLRLAEHRWTLPALLLIDVYGGDGPLLDAVFEGAGRSLPVYFERLREAAESEDPRARLEEWARKSEKTVGMGTSPPRAPFCGPIPGWNDETGAAGPARARIHPTRSKEG